VTLVSGPTDLPDPFGVTTVRVVTAEEMRQACLSAYPTTDVVIAAAAVSDFRPIAVHAHKQEKATAPLSIETERTVDIVKELAASKGSRLVIGFAAQTQDVLEAASRKLAEKNLDAVIANDVSQPGLGFASDDNRVWVVTADGVEGIEVMSKTRISRALWDRFADAAANAAELRR